MKLLSQRRDYIINDECEFYISNPDSPITSIYAGDKFIGLYDNETAKAVITEIADAIKDGETIYYMPLEDIDIEDVCELWNAVLDVVSSKRSLLGLFGEIELPVSFEDGVFEIIMPNEFKYNYAVQNQELFQDAFNMLLGKEYEINFTNYFESEAPIDLPNSNRKILDKLWVSVMEMIEKVDPSISLIYNGTEIELIDEETAGIYCRDEYVKRLVYSHEEQLRDAFTIIFGNPYDLEICEEKYDYDDDDEDDDEDENENENIENENVAEEEK